MAASGVGANLGFFIPGIEVLDLLGRGARTEVFRCRHLGRDYALKVGRSDIGAAGSRSGFRREAALLALARHSALPEIYEVGEADGRPYMVMELVSGKALSDLIVNGPLDESTVVRIAIDVAGGLAAAHRRGLVHLDVKPDNIIVAADGRAKLIDFGLAARSGQLVDETFVGTLYYASPEQTGMIKRPVDRRSDLYSLGVVLFEALAGVRPFESDDPGEVVRMHAASLPASLGSIRPDVSGAMDAMVAKLLAKDPDDRYHSADELVWELSGNRDGTWAERGGRTSKMWGALVDPAEGSCFIGRRAELDELAQAWKRARSGRVCEVDVLGDTGIGKSRLVREFLRKLEQPDALGNSKPPLVLYSTSPVQGAVPFAALRAAFSRLIEILDELDGPGRFRLVGLVKQAAGPFGAVVGTLSAELAKVLEVEVPDTTALGDSQFAVTFAHFMVELARRSSGLCIWVDDAQRVDDATNDLLDLLSASYDRSPLMIVRCWGVEPKADVPARLPASALRLRLGPLEHDVLAALASYYFGGSVNEVLAARMAVRAGGNPLALYECLSAAIDGGVVWCAWGKWQMDHEKLDSLDLPERVGDLVMRKVANLSPQQRRLLTLAAAVGSPFDIDLLRRLDSESVEVDQVITAAVWSSLVEMRSATSAAFVHDRIGESLLSSLGPDELADLHQRIAEELDTEARGGEPLVGEALFTTARHYRMGRVGSNPARVVELCRRAGQAALDVQASREAYELLVGANEAAEAFGLGVDASFELQLADAYLKDGRSVDASKHLDLAVAKSEDPWTRARARAQLSRIDFTEGRYDKAEGHVDAALRDVGHRMVRNAMARVVVGIVNGVMAWTAARVHFRLGVAKGEERERFTILASLYDMGGSTSYMRRDPIGMLAFSMTELRVVNRLGLSPAYLRVHSSLCSLGAILHMRRAARRSLPRLRTMAQEMGNPAVMAQVAMNAVVTTELLGDPNRAAQLARRTLTELGRWMEPGERQMVLTLLGVNLIVRGHYVECRRWLERQEAQRTRGDDPREDLLAILSQTADAATSGTSASAPSVRYYLERMKQLETYSDRSQRVQVLEALVGRLVVERDLGEIFDEVVKLRLAEGISVLSSSMFDRLDYYLTAQGRLAQWREALACGAEQPELARRRQQARSAVRLARAAARGVPQPTIKTQAMVVSAAFAGMNGHARRALRLLAKADRLAAEHDVAIARRDVAAQRAHLFHRMGLTAQARAEAAMAIGLAVGHGWHHLARTTRAEFSHLLDTAEPSDSSAFRPIGVSSSDPGDRSAGDDKRDSAMPLGRRLAALMQVSVAAANVIDPRQLARIALDEAISLLGAERALLFLVEDDEKSSARRAGSDRAQQSGRFGADGGASCALGFYAGRNSSREDIGAVEYSSTVLEAAQDRRRPVVVTGSDEGAVLGSRSAVIHGLRSIVAAPLLLENRLIGVVYLDSRLAKNIFTRADADLLVAIGTQVAVGLETARSAQLEMMVRTEREQRSLVEALRDVMASMTSTLDPREVLNRLLVGLARVVEYDAASVSLLGDLRSGSAPEVLAAHGPGYDPLAPVRAGEPAAIESLLKGQPVLDPDGKGSPPGVVPSGGVGSWVAVPMRLSHDVDAGLMVVSSTAFAYGETQLEIVRTVAAHGLVGYHNARLFAANRQLAVTDELSGLANRRRFFDLASARLVEALQDGSCVSLLMIDIDHFKQINDTFGHPTGDEVIREVARRLSSQAQGAHIIARYGGEEFALLFAEDADAVAAAAETMREAVAKEAIETRSGPIEVTISVGAVTATASSGSHGVADGGGTFLEELIARADEALYEAKTAGRNRVVVACEAA